MRARSVGEIVFLVIAVSSQDTFRSNQDLPQTLTPTLSQREREFRKSGPSPAEQHSRVVSILDTSIFYGLIAVIALTAIPYGTVESWSEALFECAVFFLTLLWIVQGFLEGSWRVGNTRLLWPMIALVFLAAVQSVAWWQTDLAGEKVWFALSADPFESRAFAFRMAALILAALLVIRFTSNTKRLGILVHVLIAVAVGSALFGIARQAMQHGDGFVLSRLALDQGFGQFINKNHFAFLIEMALGLILGVAFMRRGRRDRVLLYLSALLLTGAAIILSHSRGGLLATAVQIIFAALLFVNSRSFGRHGKREGRWIRWTRSLVVTTVAVGALLLIIATGVLWLGGDQFATGVETATLEMAGVDRSEMHEAARRRDIWRATWLMFKAHPIAGAGLGGYWAEVPVYHSASGVLTPQQAHNDYLELLASGGVVGALLFVWFAIAFVRQARESVKAAEGFQRAVLLGAMISVVGVGVHSIVDFGLHITINALFFVVLVGIVSLNRMSPRSSGAVARP
jgi:O-antigen ligase